MKESKEITLSTQAQELSRNTMKRIELEKQMLYHIISEPGDSTLYDYIMIKYYDDYLIAPRDSTFQFPQKINKYLTFGVNCQIDYIRKHRMPEQVVQVASDSNSNVYTVLEVFRTIQELEGKTE